MGKIFRIFRKLYKKMKNRIVEVNAGGVPAYKIHIEDTFENLPEYLAEFSMNERKVCIITDDNVAPLYLEEVKLQLEKAAKQVFAFVIPAGEQNKTLDTVKNIYEFLIQNKMERKDYLVALGGGVVGDITGFAAATYLRGISFIQVPTTLLSQVDSSIGGKTGVDFDSYKNMVGAFHQPSMVLINVNTLQTLPGEQLASGMGEVLKHGLIQDENYYEWIINHMDGILARKPVVLAKTVLGSVEIKGKVVEKDPNEKGLRAILNFGHTLGHAIEKLENFQMLHGECVALGMICASYISWKRGYISEEEFFEIRDMQVGFSLPITYEGAGAEDILAVSRSDKKMENGTIKFILLKELGKAEIFRDVTEKEMKEALEFLKGQEQQNNILKGE